MQISLDQQGALSIGASVALAITDAATINCNAQAVPIAEASALP